MRIFLAICATAGLFAPVFAAEPLRLSVTRDTWFSEVGPEADGNNGGSPRLKVKSIQEFTLLDFDPAPLRGKIVRRATLHLKAASPPDVLHRVTVATFASPWVEGTATSYRPQKGSSSFNHQQHPAKLWAFPGSTLIDVTLSQGGTIWRMANATPPDANGWQRVAVEPAVIMARVAGISQGLFVFDDTGSEWKRDGEKFTRKLFPNRFLYSRDDNAKRAPYLTVELGDADSTAPAAPTAAAPKRNDRRPPISEGVNVYWTTPTDQGAGVAGFRVEIDGKPLPRYLIPAPRQAGQPVRMRLRPGDCALKSPRFTVTVRAVDGAGNVSKPLELRQDFAGWEAPYQWKTAAPKLPEKSEAAPRLAGAEVFVIDALDKVHPISGAMIPPQPKEYPTANHLWDGRTIHLHAARNEFIGFQLLIRGALEGLTPTIELGPAIRDVGVSFYRYAHVPSKSGPLPDPLVPLKGAFSIPTPSEHITGQKSGSLLAELYVGHDTRPGRHTAKLQLRAGKETLTIPIELTVWDFALPDRLSFVPEMNCYGLPDNERDYYRLAHWHRTVINRVPYYQNGIVADGCAPKWDGKTLDWAAWDKRFGLLLDGSAFADLPRKNVPLDIFYLPLHENWPTPMAGNYNGSYWADQAFPPRYREAFVSASRQFAAHFADRKWKDTLFLGFLNNKVDFKSKGWSRASSPWLLDEPANWQDYWALRWFGEAFHEGARDNKQMLFRCDISRPQWQRDSLDALLDYNVVSASAFNQHHRLVLDRRDRLGQIVMVYGSTNNIEASNVQPAGWCLDAWTLGADGIVPWQTIGTRDSWKKADELSLFYPGGPAGLRGPVPSVRLKAYLRGQQDVEYLALLQASGPRSRHAIGDAVRRLLKLKAVWHGTGFAGEDAGVVEFGNLRPQDLWALRQRVAGELARGPVKAAQPLSAAPIPKRDFAIASPGHVSTEPATSR